MTLPKVSNNKLTCNSSRCRRCVQLDKQFKVGKIAVSDQSRIVEGTPYYSGYNRAIHVQF